MRRSLPIVLVFLLLPWLCRAVVLDWIVATVGKQAITQSELELNLRLTAFLQQAPLDFSDAARRSAVARLVEQKLVLQELDFSKFPRPSPDEVEPRLRTIAAERFGASDPAFRAALEEYGITADDLKKHLLWIITFVRFLDFRFRPGIQVTEAEIEQDFKTRILPLAQKAYPGKAITIDQYRDRIERYLMARREEVEMQSWLADARRRTKIEYREEALKPPPQPEVVAK